MEKSEKNNKRILYIIIGILGVLVLVFGIYVVCDLVGVFDKTLKNGQDTLKKDTLLDDKHEDNETEKETLIDDKLEDGKLDVNSDLVLKLYKKVTNGSSLCHSIRNTEKLDTVYIDSVTSQEAFYMAFSLVEDKDVKTADCNHIAVWAEVKDVYHSIYCGNSVYDENSKKFVNPDGSNGTTNLYSDALIYNNVKYIFGKDMLAGTTEFYISNRNYKYVSQLEGYIVTTGSRGSCDIYQKLKSSELISAENVQNKIIIVENLYVNTLELGDANLKYTYTFEYDANTDDYYFSSLKKEKI